MGRTLGEARDLCVPIVHGELNLNGIPNVTFLVERCRIDWMSMDVDSGHV